MSARNLSSLGRDFETTHAQWLLRPDGHGRDYLLDRLNCLAEAIRLIPAETLEDVAIKGRNLLWAFGLTHAGVPELDADPARNELASFVAEVEALVSESGVVPFRPRVRQ